MAEEKCAKCGAKLPTGALICHECKALTPAGRQARGLGADDEEQAWTESVQAAKARQANRPQLDPDEVLRQVVAQTGTQDQIQRLTRDDIAHDDRRTGYAGFRASGKGLPMIGTLLAVLFAVVGLLALVMTIALAKDGAIAIIGGVGAAVFMGSLALAVYFIFRFAAEAAAVFADQADNSRRTVLLLRELPMAAKDDNSPHA